MIVEHTLTIEAICPFDGKRRYTCTCTVETCRTIKVEEILEAISQITVNPLYQENLTQKLHERLGCKVTTVGQHAPGVTTRVTVPF